MRKSLLSLIVGLGVLLATLTSEPAAFGQRRSSGGSSSGRSYSSGSSSSSRTSSSGRSTPSSAPKSPAPSRPSSPSPSRPSSSGKSYSSGPQTAPARPTSGKSNPPSTSSPEKRNSTPGPRQSFPDNTRPRTATFDAAAAAAQQKDQSRIAYTNKSTPAGAPTASSIPTPTVHPSGKTFAKNGYDAGPAQAQRREESRVAYQSGTAPKPTYKTSGGMEKPIEPKSPQVDYVRRTTTPELWQTRAMRTRVVYGPYYGRRAVVYNDPYNSFFWYWLLSQNLDSQANWAYHHRYEMDRARYNDLINRNATLAARVNQLEESKLPRDVSYAPPGIDPDLIYADDYVDAVYNPQVSEAGAPDSKSVSYKPSTVPVELRRARAWKAFWQGILAIATTTALTFFLIWLVFIKRWGGDKPTPAPVRPGRRARR